MTRRWRSLLFVPADRPQLAEKASRSQPDAVILDLEDSIPASGKDRARRTAPKLVRQLAAQGLDVLVRVNTGPAMREDLRALARAPLTGIVLPKSETAADVAERLDLAAETGHAVPVVALLESPASVFEAQAIGGVPGVIGLALGTEDFSFHLGVAPTSAALDLPCRMVCLAAAARHVQAFAVPFSIGSFRDVTGLGAAAKDAAAFGATGMLCVHPAQVAVANAAFAPSQAAIDRARWILDAWRARPNASDGVISLDGQMIDAPVVEAARRLLG